MTESPRADRYGITDIGKVREANEDQFLIADLAKSVLVERTSLTMDDGSRWFGETQGSVMLVADGMGGHAAGERASRLAVDQLVRYILNTMPWSPQAELQDEEGLKCELSDALRNCQEAIQAEGKTSPERRGMGTTLTAVYTRWPKLCVVHVGDSRCYLLRESNLQQITTDHTMAQEMLERGALTPEQAKDSSLGHVLWNTVGGESTELTADVYKRDLKPGDTLLLCTDGLTGHVADDVIARTLEQSESAEEACRELLKSAMEAGGSDNVTVVVARYTMRRPEDAGIATARADRSDVLPDPAQIPLPAAIARPGQVELEAAGDALEDHA